MTIAAWGSAVALLAASVLIGEALRLLGLRCRSAGPAVGMAALIVIAAAAIRLPGRATTAAIVLLIVILLCAFVVARGWRSGRAPKGDVWLAGLAALLLAGFGAAIPFIANGHIGLPGVSLDNDTANHLVWAQALRSPVVGQRYGLPTGYPLGPHSLADAVSTGLGVRLDMAFTGLLIATVLLTALVGTGVLRREAAWKRPIAGVLAALLYLPAAYYAEASFKEMLLGMILLAAVLHLEEQRGDRLAGSSVAARHRGREILPVLLPLSILFAGTIYVYSYLAIVWIVLTLVIWLGAELVFELATPREEPAPSAAGRPRAPRGIASSGLGRGARQRLSDIGGLLGALWAPVGIAVAVGVVLLLPTAGRILSFLGTVGASPSATGAISTSNFGNLAYPLSVNEALGLWNAPDFRLLPLGNAGLLHAGEMAGFALVVLAGGMFWAVRRRELILPAAVAACGIIFWRASNGQSPYVSAKALAIAGPVVAAVEARILLRNPIPNPSRWLTAGRLAVAVAFVALALHSSYLALRDEPVWAPESPRELLSLAPYVRGQPLLFLGASDYADWIFADADMSALAPDSVSAGQAAPSPMKPNAYGTALDFDSVAASTVNRFKWFITTSTAFASQPPSGVTLVRRTPMYELWRRAGTIMPRKTLEAPGQPGAVLDCGTATGRALSRRRGTAAVMAPPATAALSAVAPGNADTTTLRLHPGRWQLSLQYESPVSISITDGAHLWRLPAYDDRPGPYFPFGTIVSSGGPLVVTVRADRPSALTGPLLAALLTSVAAVPLPDTRRIVPLSRACGRYVDWYRLEP